MRVNYSMNAMLDRGRKLSDGRRVSERGVRMIRIESPATKLLLLDEDPATNRNGSFYPGGTAADGEFMTHSGRINVSFVDTHVDELTHQKVMEIQRSRNKPIWFEPY